MGGRELLLSPLGPTRPSGVAAILHPPCMFKARVKRTRHFHLTQFNVVKFALLNAFEMNDGMMVNGQC